jgi:hypothetical protein
MTRKLAFVLTAVAVVVIASLTTKRKTAVLPISDSGAVATPAWDSVTVGRYVPYSIVDQWRVGAVLLIAPENRNEADLRLLGEQIRRGASGHTHWIVDVFDDSALALQHREAMNNDRVANSRVVKYVKNTTSGAEWLNITLAGYQGRVININYGRTLQAGPR